MPRALHGVPTVLVNAFTIINIRVENAELNRTEKNDKDRQDDAHRVGVAVAVEAKGGLVDLIHDRTRVKVWPSGSQ